MIDLTPRARMASLVIGLLALSLSGCRGAPAAQVLIPTVEGAEEQQATCKPAKDPLNPLIVEWPGTSKVELDTASQRGIVVVSYAGCVLKVLSSCDAGGSYKLRTVTPVRDRITVEDETDLYARLPLAVATLKGELATAGRLELEYVAVGQRAAERHPDTLSGDCRGATHYVRSIMVGAYSLDAGAKARAGVSATLHDKGGGVDHREEVRHLRGSGDVTLCEKAVKDASCDAVLQLGLAPLAMGSGGAALAAGFGEGIGAVTVVPQMGEVRAVGAPGGLADADVVLLRKLQDAKRADRSRDPAVAKADAWGRLFAYPGKNPYRELAQRRQDEWKHVAEAEARRSEQVARVCAQYSKDKAKLDQLVALDDDVVPAAQKDAYKKELAQVYGPFAAALKECGGVPAVGQMVSLAGGTFQMGSLSGDDDERPVHPVTVRPFELDVTEVSTGAYAACVKAQTCTEPRAGGSCNWGRADRQDHPINCVDWYQAGSYCLWARKRLPTEEEWELAARGGDGRRWPWGDREAPGAVCWKNGGGTCPVGSARGDESPSGVLDLAGNVWEWTSSPYCRYPNHACADTARVYRGGSWAETDVSKLRVAARSPLEPLYQDGGLGFRCAR